MTTSWPATINFYNECSAHRMQETPLIAQAWARHFIQLCDQAADALGFPLIAALSLASVPATRTFLRPSAKLFIEHS